VISPQAEKYVRRDAPVEVRRLAAAGALPLEPIELATVLYALVHDPDLEVKTRARESLERLPEAVASGVLSGDAHPALLRWLAEAWRDHADRMEKLALNPATDDRTYVLLAGMPHRRVVEIVANNQTRLLRHSEIVEALGNNPLTGRATIDRILSFLGMERPAAEVAEEGGGTAPPVAPEALTDESALAALRELLGDDASAFAPELIEELAEEELDEEKQGNLFALVQKMNVMQKIKLARMGNKEARGLLIRDRNKIVASAAIRSPKLSAQEVEGFAKARNVSDEVLRIISNNRDWTRSYGVKLALATNPKCPVPTAMKFANYLQERDLRGLMKSKDVPTPIATHARRLLSKKGKV
jgi:hypothetical protein